MPRLNRRIKVISIRLSDQEYEHLQTFCGTGEFDSISEFARKAIKQLAVHENGAKSAIESRVNEIDMRMSRLDREVSRLSTMMGVERLGDKETR